MIFSYFFSSKNAESMEDIQICPNFGHALSHQQSFDFSHRSHSPVRFDRIASTPGSYPAPDDKRQVHMLKFQHSGIFEPVGDSNVCHVI